MGKYASRREPTSVWAIYIDRYDVKIAQSVNVTTLFHTSRVNRHNNQPPVGAGVEVASISHIKSSAKAQKACENQTLQFNTTAGMTNQQDELTNSNDTKLH